MFDAPSLELVPDDFEAVQSAMRRWELQKGQEAALIVPSLREPVCSEREVLIPIWSCPSVSRDGDSARHIQQQLLLNLR